MTATTFSSRRITDTIAGVVFASAIATAIGLGMAYGAFGALGGLVLGAVLPIAVLYSATLRSRALAVPAAAVSAAVAVAAGLDSFAALSRAEFAAPDMVLLSGPVADAVIAFGPSVLVAAAALAVIAARLSGATVEVRYTRTDRRPQV